jgi:hypothetical protein
MTVPKRKNVKKPGAAVRPRKQAPDSTISLFTGIENHLAKNKKVYLLVILASAVLFSFLCFDTKISTANDDALYIEAAAKYAKDFFGRGSYYTTTAPLYVMVLGLLIKIFGIKLFILKLFSIVFFCAGLYFVYRAFSGRVPFIVLIPALLITATNFPFLMYASLTYTETFSLMVFAIAFVLIFRVLDKTESAQGWKNILRGFILLGPLLLVLMITRNVALAASGVLILFLIYRKKYIEAAITAASFAVSALVYNFAVRWIWQVEGSQFSSQGSVMMNKDAYNPQLGKETLTGFIIRFWENCKIYLSSRLYYILGFREEMSPTDTFLTLITIGLMAWSLFIMHKKKQYPLILMTLFFGGLLAATFLSLHTSWGQTRLIMLYLPFMLMNIFYLLYAYGIRFTFLQALLPFVFFVLFITGLKTTIQQTGERFPVFKENISGDPTYGYTPDWQNYIRMTKWCAKNLPNDLIAVRKAPMSFIFSEGKEFYPIYNTPTSNPDSLLIPFIQFNKETRKTDTVKYLMTSELRIDPSRYIEGQFIGTMHRYAYYIAQKYPQAFQYVHGEGDVEKSELYKIDYAYIDSVRKAGGNR